MLYCRLKSRVPCIESCIAIAAHCCCGAAAHSSLRGDATWKRQVDGEKEGQNMDLDRHGERFREGDLGCNSVCVCESCSSFRALVNA